MEEQKIEQINEVASMMWQWFEEVNKKQYVVSITIDGNNIVTTYQNGFKQSITLPDVNSQLLKDEFLKLVNIKLLEQEAKILNNVRKFIDKNKPKDGKDGLRGRQGQRGEKGKDGNGIISARIDEGGRLIITTDEKEIDAGAVMLQRFYGGAVAPSIKYSNDVPMPNAVGGFVQGTKFDNVDYRSLITRLLYGSELPYFNSFTLENVPSEIEVGYTLVVGEYTALFDIANPMLVRENSIEIKQDDEVLVKELPNSSPITLNLEEIKHDCATTVTFEISAFDSTGVSFNSYYNLAFKHRIYYGEYTEDIDDNNLDNPLLVLRASELVDSIISDYHFLDVGYKWFCYPAILGENYTFCDASTDIALVFEEPIKKEITNEYGLAILYNCYRTSSELNSEITMRIK